MTQRRKPKRDRTVPEQLFGDVWARRLRYAIPVVGLLIFLGGCSIFVLWSQVIGTFVLLPGVFVGAMWAAARHGFDNDPMGAWRRRRWAFFSCGLALAAVGWVLFFTVDGDLGLLAVVLGGLAISAATLGVRRDVAGGPTDGPWYGETH